MEVKKMSGERSQRVGVGYARVSTEDQEERDSLETQEMVLREYCKAHNIQLVKIYKDAKSGKRKVNRKAFLQMLSDILENEEIQVVMARDIERLGRFAFDLLSLRMIAEEQDLQLILTEKGRPIDFNDPYEALLFTQMAGFAEFFPEVQRLKIIEGIRRRKMQGLPVGRPPRNLLKNKRDRFLLKQCILTKRSINQTRQFLRCSWEKANHFYHKLKQEMIEKGELDTEGNPVN